MGWVTDWSNAEALDVEELEIDNFSPILQTVSDWMDYEADPYTVVGILRQVIWADMEVPVVVGTHGEIIQGLPQLLKAYIEGREVIRTVRLKPPGYSLTYIQ